MTNKTSEAQLKASKKWNEKNKDYLRKKNYKSKGIKFIKEYSTLEDLEEFEEIIRIRRGEL